MELSVSRYPNGREKLCWDIAVIFSLSVFTGLMIRLVGVNLGKGSQISDHRDDVDDEESGGHECAGYIEYRPGNAADGNSEVGPGIVHEEYADCDDYEAHLSGAEFGVSQFELIEHDCGEIGIDGEAEVTAHYEEGDAELHDRCQSESHAEETCGEGIEGMVDEEAVFRSAVTTNFCDGAVKAVAIPVDHHKEGCEPEVVDVKIGHPAEERV